MGVGWGGGGCMERSYGEEVLNFKHVELEMPVEHPKSYHQEVHLKGEKE